MKLTENAEGMSEELNTENEKYDIKRWLQDKIWELRSKGFTYQEILAELKGDREDIKLSMGTIHNYIEAKKQQIARDYQKYIDEDLPAKHALALANLQSINREAWRIFDSTKDEKTKLQALHTAKEAQQAMNEMLSDPEYISKAIGIAKKLKGQLSSKHTSEPESEVDKEVAKEDAR